MQNNQDNFLNIFMWEITTKTVIIRGDPGSGKTQLGWLLTLWYTRIYSNVDFFKNWKLMNKQVKYMSDIKNIEFSETPGILLIDEMWVNGNSRKSMSKENIEFWELGMLQRKYNLYVVWIAQKDFSFDKNQRLSANLILHCRAIERKNYHMMVNITREKMHRTATSHLMLFDAERNIDIINIMKHLGRKYNQLDQSKIIWKKTTAEQKENAAKKKLTKID